MLDFLDRRHRNAVKETEVVPSASVTTALIILLKATGHGQDLRGVVQDMDTVEWEPGRLALKLKRTLSKLAQNREQIRMLRSTCTSAKIKALRRCLNRPLAEKYECMPVLKMGPKKIPPSRKSLEEALKSCEDSIAKAVGAEDYAAALASKNQAISLHEKLAAFPTSMYITL